MGFHFPFFSFGERISEPTYFVYRFRLKVAFQV